MKKFVTVLLSLVLISSIGIVSFADNEVPIRDEAIPENIILPKEDEINAYTKASSDLSQSFVDEYGTDLGYGIIRYTWKYNKEAGLAELTGKTLYSYPSSSNYRISASYSDVTTASFVVRISFVDMTSTLPSQVYKYKVTVYSNGGTDQILLP